MSNLIKCTFRHKLWCISHVYAPCINIQNCLVHPQIAQRTPHNFRGCTRNLGGVLSNFRYLCTVHKHGLCTITYAFIKYQTQTKQKKYQNHTSYQCGQFMESPRSFTLAHIFRGPKNPKDKKPRSPTKNSFFFSLFTK